MVGEMFRHCKSIAVAPEATSVLAAAGLPEDAVGVVIDDPTTAVAELVTLLGSHRVWDRFPAVVTVPSS